MFSCILSLFICSLHCLSSPRLPCCSSLPFLANFLRPPGALSRLLTGQDAPLGSSSEALGPCRPLASPQGGMGTSPFPGGPHLQTFLAFSLEWLESLSLHLADLRSALCHQANGSWGLGDQPPFMCWPIQGGLPPSPCLLFQNAESLWTRISENDPHAFFRGWGRGAAWLVEGSGV